MTVLFRTITFICSFSLLSSSLIASETTAENPASIATSKKQILFIINPYAGKGETKEIERSIFKTIDREQFKFEISYTKGPKDAIELSRKAANDHYDLVVAVGGDGTVNEVAKGLIGSTTALGIIPFGSGNGFARQLNIPMKPKEAVELLNYDNKRQIDTIKINDEVSLCVTGVGFDAHVSTAFAEYKKRGLTSYLKIALQQFPDYEAQEYELVIDGEKIKKRAFLICFANCAQYGNNAYIAPRAKIDDGLVDVLIVKEFPSTATPKLLLDLFNKKIDKSKYIETLRCKEAIIQPPFYEVHIDGEPFVFEKPLHIEVQPLSLTVIAPLS